MKWMEAILVGMLATAALAQQPQTQTAPTYAVNAKYVNGVAPGYAPTAGSGLTLNLGPGTANCGSGTIVTYAAAGLTMTASTTNYVYLNTAASCVPAVKTSTFVAADIPIAQVVTSSSAITQITDDRTLFNSVAAPDVVYASAYLIDNTSVNSCTSAWGNLLAATPTNGTISVGPVTSGYSCASGSVTINKPLTISCSGGVQYNQETGTWTTPANFFNTTFSVTSPGVSIIGCGVNNKTDVDASATAIQYAGSSGFDSNGVVAHNVMTGPSSVTGHGILIQGVNHVTLNDNYADGFDFGIALRSSYDKVDGLSCGANIGDSCIVVKGAANFGTGSSIWNDAAHDRVTNVSSLSGGISFYGDGAAAGGNVYDNVVANATLKNSPVGVIWGNQGVGATTFSGDDVTNIVCHGCVVGAYPVTVSGTVSGAISNSSFIGGVTGLAGPYGSNAATVTVSGTIASGNSTANYESGYLYDSSASGLTVGYLPKMSSTAGPAALQNSAVQEVGGALYITEQTSIDNIALGYMNIASNWAAINPSAGAFNFEMFGVNTTTLGTYNFTAGSSDNSLTHNYLSLWPTLAAFGEQVSAPSLQSAATGSSPSTSPICPDGIDGTYTTSCVGGYEPPLGNPGASGYILSSTTDGVRSWIAPSAHSDYASIQGTLFATSTMLGPVFAEPLQVHYKTIIVRLSGTISCTDAPIVTMMDLGTSPATAFGSAVGSVDSVTTGTSDGVYQHSASVNMTPGDYYGFAFTGGTCVTPPTFDITAQVQ